jgi:hypothetical protein
VNPEVRQSLIDGPYRVALECGIDLSEDSPSPPRKMRASLERVRKAVQKWCVRWGLSDSWCEDLGSDTVLGWVRDPESKGRWAGKIGNGLTKAHFPSSATSGSRSRAGASCFGLGTILKRLCRRLTGGNSSNIAGKPSARRKKVTGSFAPEQSEQETTISGSPGTCYSGRAPLRSPSSA